MDSLLSMLEKAGATVVGLADGIETVTIEVNKYQPPKTVTITIEDCIWASGTPKWGIEWSCSDGRGDKYGVEKSKQPDKLKVVQDIINQI